RRLVQRPPLTVELVQALEDIVLGVSRVKFNDYDRVCAGFFCFAVYARARYSDAQASAALQLDILEADGCHGFLEASVTRSKTSYSLERKTRYLPVVAPVMGVRADPWGVVWHELLLKLGVELKEGAPLLPVPLQGGGFQQLPVSAEHAGQLLRELLRRELGDSAAINALGTHSLKRTILSWLAKYGVAREIRAILGYHSTDCGTEIIYARDTLSGPLRLMQEVIEAVTFGRFRPDATRSGYFASEKLARNSDPQEEHDSSSCGSEDEEAPDHAEAEVRVVLNFNGSAGLLEVLEAVFKKRVESSGLSKEDATNLLSGLRTLKQLAFVSSYTPGQADEKPLLDAFTKLVKRDTGADLAAQASFRALFHTAYAIVTTELRQAVEKTDESVTRTLSAPEREERYTRQVKKLAGVSIKGDSEPSEALVDYCVSIYEANTLRFIPWEKCTSRLAELQGDAKKDTRFTHDAQGKALKLETKPQDLQCAVDSEIHVMQALQRRALACDQANLIDYTVLEEWHQRLLRARLFAEMQDRSRAGIQSDATGRAHDGKGRGKSKGKRTGVLPKVTVLDLFGHNGLFGKACAASGFHVLTYDVKKPERATHKVRLFRPERPAAWEFFARLILAHKTFHVMVYLSDAVDVSVGRALVSLLQREHVQAKWTVLGPVAWAVLDQLRPMRLCACRLHLGSGPAKIAGYCPCQQPSEFCSCPDTSQFAPTKQFAELFAESLRLAAADAGLRVDAQAQLPCHNAWVQRQAKSSKMQPVMPEYRYTVTVCVPDASALSLDSKSCLSVALHSVPAGSRPASATFGVYRTQQEFVSASLELEHPFDAFAYIPDGAELHKTLDGSVASVLRGKKLLLLERIAQSLGWPDGGLFEDIKIASAATELDQELWQKTLAERDDKGWISGPYTYEELDSMFGPTWLPVRRFGIRQRAKLRCIDDLSENAVNASWEVAEKIDLRALDELLWVASRLMKVMLDKGYVDLQLSDGSKVRGPLHPMWKSNSSGVKPVLKCVDLESAYKQWPIRPQDSKRCVISLRRPSDGLPVGFVCHVLPFGGLASVGHFNRVARLLQRIMIELGCMAFNYFDDYPVLDLSLTSGSTEKTIRAL
ncbi:unnamed protein product, partial [Symbiodinium sp. CCMP2456]